MCCNSSLKAKREFLKSLGRRKAFVAWKVLRVGRYGPGLWSCFARHRWRQGVNGAARQTERYNINNPSGFHVFLRKPKRRLRRSRKLVPVICHRDDLCRVESVRWHFRVGCNQQAVIRNKVVLRRKDYEAAMKGAGS